MTIRVLHGDMRAVLADMAADSFDACVTDPPYHLIAGGIGLRSMMVDGKGHTLTSSARGGFMNAKWDGGGVAFDPNTWRAVFRVLKPGAHMLAFGGTRTSHRMVCAIEDAGFEVRDTLCWIYGSGFPKSLNPGEHMDRDWWDETEWYERSERSHRSAYWGRFGTALKPAYEPIVLCRKPLSERNVAANVLRHGTGAINVDGCRIPGAVISNPLVRNAPGFQSEGLANQGPTGNGVISEGRFPANIVHDGSDEVEAAFAVFGDARSAGDYPSQSHSDGNRTVFSSGLSRQGPLYQDAGSASRFFYSAKATVADRADSRHPTVKPLALTEYLVKLITPPGGTVLDPFAGSGITAEACMKLGFDCTLVEKEAAYVADIRHRIDRWSGADAPLFKVAAE